MLKKPIEITICDDNGKPKKNFKLCIIPWKMMKKFTSMFANTDKETDESEVFDQMTGLLCELFHNQFTPEELDEHSPAKETAEAMNAVMEELGMNNPNAVKEQQKAAPKK